MENLSGKRYQKTSAQVLTMLLVFVFLVTFLPLPPPAAGEVSGNENTVMVFVIDKSTYTVNGETTVMDVSPVVKEGRTMLPIRYVATPLGAKFTWDNATKQVTVSLENTKIELFIGKNNALKNGNTIPIDANNPNVKPLIINGRTMVPIRFVSENLGCDVNWDPATKKVTITKAGTSTPSISITPGLEGNKPDLQKETSGETILPGLQGVIQAPDLNKLVLSTDLTGIKQTWGEQPIGKPFKVNVTEKDIPVVIRLGRGYDVFGQYAHVASLKQPVLDIEKLLQDQKVQAIRYDEGYDNSITARSIRSYSSQMSGKVDASGKYLCFGGSVNVNFDSSRTEQLENYFSTYYWIVKKYGTYIDGTVNLKNYLLPNAKQMINDKNVPAKTVFDNFGHYVLVDAITGGRVDYSVTASSKASTSYENFKIATKADFNALILNASVSGAYQNVQNRSEYESSKLESAHSYGGSFTLNTGSFKNNPNVLDLWQATLENNGTLVEFGNTTAKSLVPIWELCNDPARAASLKAEFEKLNASHANNNKWPVEKYVVDVTFVYDNNEWAARAKCPPGYQLYNADLNAGSGGAFIYLCYKLGENPDDAITDFFMEYSGSEAPATTTTVSHNGNNVPYTRVGLDLNKGAGGDFIYLWYTKAKTLSPVTDMGVAFDNVGWPEYDSVCWQNTQSPADVNKSVGGATIIIKFKR